MQKTEVKCQQRRIVEATSQKPRGQRGNKGGIQKGRRGRTEREGKDQEAAKRSAACVWLFFMLKRLLLAVFGALYFADCKHFIYSEFTDTNRGGRGGGAEAIGTGVESTLTADWNVDGNFDQIASVETILRILGAVCLFNHSKVSTYLRIFASTYLRIYGVIKNVSLYLSVGPKLFVTLYASSSWWCGGWCNLSGFCVASCV